MLTRPRRAVVARPAGYSVEPTLGDPFVTTWEPLAEAVAREFDRLDPLPFPEHDCTEDAAEARTLGGYGRTICRQCGHASALVFAAGGPVSPGRPFVVGD